jgi:hypothetical protein
MFGIVNTWQFYNSMLPYRTGELSYIYLLKKKENISLSESTASLFVSRIFDLLVFLFCCAFFLLLTSAGIKAGINYIYYVSITISLIAGIGFFFLYKITFGFRIIIFILHKTNLVQFKFARKMASFLQDVMQNINLLRSQKKFLRTFLLTVLLTLSMNLNAYLVIRYFNVDLNFFEIFIATSFTFLTLFLPIQGFANIGTFEASFIMGLMLFGIDKNIGLSAAFALHIIFYIMLVIIFIFVSLIYKFNKRTDLSQKNRPLLK